MNARQRRLAQRQRDRALATWSKDMQTFLDALPPFVRAINERQLFGTLPPAPVRPKGLFSTYKDRQA